MEADGVSQHPGRESEAETEHRGARESPAHPRGISAVEQGSGEQRGEREAGRAHERGERERTAGEQPHSRRRPVDANEEEEARARREDEVQRLALDLGAEEEKGGMEGREAAGRESDRAAREHAAGDRREKDDERGAEERVPDLVQRDPSGMAERAHGEEKRISRRSKEERVRVAGVRTLPHEPLGRANVRERIPEPDRGETARGGGREARRERDGEE